MKSADLNARAWSNRKLRALTDAEHRTYTMLLSYCADEENDGFLTLADVADVCALHGHAGDGEAILEGLRTKRMLDDTDTTGTYRIHDWLDYHPSVEQLEEHREQKRQAGRIGGLKSGKTRRRKAGATAPAKADAKATAEAPAKQPPKQTRSSGEPPSPVSLPSLSLPVPPRPAPPRPGPSGQGAEAVGTSGDARENDAHPRAAHGLGAAARGPRAQRKDHRTGRDRNGTDDEHADARAALDRERATGGHGNHHPETGARALTPDEVIAKAEELDPDAIAAERARPHPDLHPLALSILADHRRRQAQARTATTRAEHAPAIANTAETLKRQAVAAQAAEREDQRERDDERAAIEAEAHDAENASVEHTTTDEPLDFDLEEPSA